MAIQSQKHNKKTSKAEVNDNDNEKLISNLRDEIVFVSILSSLTIKEIARTRLVSHHWKRFLRHIHVLNFEDSSAHEKIRWDGLGRVICKGNLSDHERFKFVNWLNDVLAKHLGSYIDQFKVTLDLDHSYQSDIDKWVVWAFKKHVKKLELNLGHVSLITRSGLKHNRCTLHHQPLKVKPLLTSLYLKGVNVSTEFVEHVLVCSCMTLEHLCIEKSESLTSIEACCSSLQSLKYFKVIDCPNMKTINISATKLLSFTYGGTSLGLLRIVNASSLSHVTVLHHNDHLAHTFDSLSKYFSHLEFLKLQFSVRNGINLGISSCPLLANLKHLDMRVFARSHQTLYGWFPLFEACQCLEKLTLRIFGCPSVAWLTKEVERDRHLFRCLKRLVIFGYRGGDNDLDFANFVIENSLVLQEVIVETPRKFDLADAEKCVSYLKPPQGVKILLIHDSKVISM